MKFLNSNSKKERFILYLKLLNQFINHNQDINNLFIYKINFKWVNIIKDYVKILNSLNLFDSNNIDFNKKSIIWKIFSENSFWKLFEIILINKWMRINQFNSYYLCVWKNYKYKYNLNKFDNLVNCFIKEKINNYIDWLDSDDSLTTWQINQEINLIKNVWELIAKKFNNYLVKNYWNLYNFWIIFNNKNLEYVNLKHKNWVNITLISEINNSENEYLQKYYNEKISNEISTQLSLVNDQSLLWLWQLKANVSY